MEVDIRLFDANEDVPMDLLLLADPSEETVREYVNRCQCFVAVNHHEIVGVLALLKTRPHTMEIVNIAVREQHQGKGIGKKLILFAIEQAKQQKMKTVEIGTGNSSLHQLGLYQKCGFRITGVDRDFFIRHYRQEIYENGIRCRDMIRLSLDL